MATLAPEAIKTAAPWSESERAELQATALSVVDSVAGKYGITNLNRIKPGIAEATRAVMRRVPEHVLVRSKNDPDVRLLMYLTDRAGIVVQEVGNDLGPYRAITVIKKVS